MCYKRRGYSSDEASYYLNKCLGLLVCTCHMSYRGWCTLLNTERNYGKKNSKSSGGKRALHATAL